MVKTLSVEEENKKLEIQRIKYEEWQTFFQSVSETTQDSFQIDLTERIGDPFIEVDWEKEEEIIIEDAPVDGIFIDGRLVGLIETSHKSLSNGEKALDINFIMVHPDEQRKGVGKGIIRKLIQETSLKYVTMFPCSTGSQSLCEQLGFTYNPLICYTTEHQAFIKQ